jgi:hypothetical protein
LRLEVGPCGAEVVERALRGGEGQMHQLAGGVVDEHQQRALGAARLEPVMLAAVDLDQLTIAAPPWTGLVDALLALGPGEPEPVLDHPLAQGLVRNP